MKITSEIIQRNLIILEKAKKSFPKLKIYEELLKSIEDISSNGGRFSDEYINLEKEKNYLKEEFRAYRIDFYADFIDFIEQTKKFNQEVFYSKKITNKHFQQIISTLAIDDQVKEYLSKKTKSTFKRFLHSRKWDLYTGNQRSSRSRAFYVDNLYRSSAIIANYCIQNEIEIDDLHKHKIKHWYRTLLSEPESQALNEIDKTSKVIDLIIKGFEENEFDIKKINLEHLILSIKNKFTEKMMVLNKNEKIKCVEVSEIDSNLLTLNKVYEVLDLKIYRGVLKVKVIDDAGFETYFFYRNFESIKDIRDVFLDDILGDE